MIALDTNVLARLVTKDDPKQARAAAELIDAGDVCFVPITVALELEWVLRGLYELGPGADRREFQRAAWRPKPPFRAGGRSSRSGGPAGGRV